MKVNIIILLIFYYFSPTLTQQDEVAFGACPTFSMNTSFNATKFAGKWYEIKRFANKLIVGGCGRPTYTLRGRNFTVNYPTKYNTVQLTLKPQIYSFPGKYDVYVNGKKDRIPHFVLDTDYTSYGVVWGCTLQNNRNIQRLFIYSRTNTLSASTFNRIKFQLQNYRINATRLINVEQSTKICGKYF